MTVASFYERRAPHLGCGAVVFIDENGGAAPGVRLRKPQRKSD
jgi:hypothetical protein